MTPEAQRIAIAEALGWKYHGDQSVKLQAVMCWSPPGHDNWQTERIPPYPYSLDAMHEAEKEYFDPSKKTDFKKRAHGYPLCMDYDKALADLTGSHMANYHATAAQKAEAFLKTLNLWTP